MTKGKVLTIVVLAVLSGLTAYFIIGHVGGEANTVPTLETGFGILESEVELRHIYPGWEGTAPLTIINGADKDRMFQVTVELANHTKVKDGYEPLPEDFCGWFTVPEQSFNVTAGSYHQCTITIAVPEDVPEYRSEYTTMTLSDDGAGLYITNQFEVRIRVTDMMPEGLISMAIEARWYIITAEDS
jgi:hypothetical protein